MNARSMHTVRPLAAVVRVVDSEEMVALAVRLYNLGMKPEGVAAELGVGRKRVLAMIERHRDRFAEREPRKAGSGWKRAAPAPSPGLVVLRGEHIAVHLPGDFKALADLMPAKQEETMPGAPVTLMQLSDTVCRWPIVGTGTAARFCGYCIPVGKIYCEAHRERARLKEKRT